MVLLFFYIVQSCMLNQVLCFAAQVNCIIGEFIYIHLEPDQEANLGYVLFFEVQFLFFFSTLINHLRSKYAQTILCSFSEAKHAEKTGRVEQILEDVTF